MTQKTVHTARGSQTIHEGQCFGDLVLKCWDSDTLYLKNEKHGHIMMYTWDEFEELGDLFWSEL